MKSQEKEIKLNSLNLTVSNGLYRLNWWWFRLNPTVSDDVKFSTGRDESSYLWSDVGSKTIIWTAVQNVVNSLQLIFWNYFHCIFKILVIWVSILPLNVISEFVCPSGLIFFVIWFWNWFKIMIGKDNAQFLTSATYTYLAARCTLHIQTSIRTPNIDVFIQLENIDGRMLPYIDVCRPFDLFNKHRLLILYGKRMSFDKKQIIVDDMMNDGNWQLAKLENQRNHEKYSNIQKLWNG